MKTSIDNEEHPPGIPPFMDQEIIRSSTSPISNPINTIQKPFMAGYNRKIDNLRRRPGMVNRKKGREITERN